MGAKRRDLPAPSSMTFAPVMAVGSIVRFSCNLSLRDKLLETCPFSQRRCAIGSRVVHIYWESRHTFTTLSRVTCLPQA